MADPSRFLQAFVKEFGRQPKSLKELQTFSEYANKMHPGDVAGPPVLNAPGAKPSTMQPGDLGVPDPSKMQPGDIAMPPAAPATMHPGDLATPGRTGSLWDQLSPLHKSLLTAALVGSGAYGVSQLPPWQGSSPNGAPNGAPMPAGAPAALPNIDNLGFGGRQMPDPGLLPDAPANDLKATVTKRKMAKQPQPAAAPAPQAAPQPAQGVPMMDDAALREYFRSGPYDMRAR